MTEEDPGSAQRQSLARLREKVRARSSRSGGGRWTRDDLVQLEYELAERDIDARVRAEFGDRERLTEAHLDVTWTGIAIAAETVAEPHVEPVLRVLAQQLADHPSAEFTGAKPDSPPKWIRFQVGEEVELVPEWLCVYWDAGTVSDVPLVLETWAKPEGQEIQVFSRSEDHPAAKDYIDALLTQGRGPRSPFRGRLLKASWGRGGVRLDILPDPDETRDRLVLPDAVWRSLDVNVHGMLARLSAFDAAGLGSNRGILLAGRPGTGKTAACRVLAREALGDATAIFVDSRVGQGLLPSLYREIGGLAPAIVFLEDLDLIVGAREDRSDRWPLLDFLGVLDGLMTQHRGVVTVATTNDPAAVDAGVRRAARFDRVVMFPVPDEAARRTILDVYLSRVDHDVDVERVARTTDGATGAELREYVRGALLTVSGVITTEDLLAAVGTDEELGGPTDRAGGVRRTYL